jgi:hypothetical protein
MKKQIIAIAVMALSGTAAFAQVTTTSFSSGGAGSLSVVNNVNQQSTYAANADGFNVSGAVAFGAGGVGSAFALTQVSTQGATNSAASGAGQGAAGGSANQSGVAGAATNAVAVDNANNPIGIADAQSNAFTASNSSAGVGGPGGTAQTGSSSAAFNTSVAGAFLTTDPNNNNAPATVAFGTTQGLNLTGTSGALTGTGVGNADGASLNTGGWTSGIMLP